MQIIYTIEFFGETVFCYTPAEVAIKHAYTRSEGGYADPVPATAEQVKAEIARFQKEDTTAAAKRVRFLKRYLAAL